MTPPIPTKFFQAAREAVQDGLIGFEIDLRAAIDNKDVTEVWRLAPQFHLLSDSEWLPIKQQLVAAIPARDLRMPDLERLRRANKRESQRGPSGDWKGGLIANENGNARPLVANALHALRNAPEWAGVLAFDLFQMTIVTRSAPPWGGKAEAIWTDADDCRAAEWLQRAGVHTPVSLVRDAIRTAAHEQAFHPIRDWLARLEWDGQPRIARWLPVYARTEDTPYARAVGERWLISGIARLLQPGCKADHVLVFEGKQGVGKSSLLAALAQPWHSDQIDDLAASKDAAMQARAGWVIELSELDSFGRAEISRIKAFISRQVDRFRPPYGHHVIHAPRECIFAGTVNCDTWQRDETGGRRFWPVACLGPLDVEGIARDRDQLWAEARARFEDGASWWLDERDLVLQAAEEVRNRYVHDPWEIPIFEGIQHQESVTIPGILLNQLRIEPNRQTRQDASRVGAILKHAGWEKFQRRVGDRREWRFRPPGTEADVKGDDNG